MASWLGSWRKKLSGRQPAVSPISDYRWTCKCCGKEMTGLPMDLAFEPPGWAGLSSEDKARSLLTDDFCKIVYADGQIDRFIRTILPIPVRDTDDEFCFGVWVSISEKSWDAYSSGFDDGIYEIDNCFGYLMHNLPDMPDTWHMHTTVEFQPANQRPRVFLNQADHPLVAAQANGISMDQVERWVAPLMQH